MVDPKRLPNRAFLIKETHSLFRSDFRSLIRKAFRCAFPSRPFQDNWHIESIGYHLQLVAEGKLSRLMISVPPRSLKSFITSVVLPL